MVNSVHAMQHEFLQKIVRRLGTVGILASYVDFADCFYLQTTCGKDLVAQRFASNPKLWPVGLVLDLLADIAVLGRASRCRVVIKNRYATFETTLSLPASQLPEDVGQHYACQFDAELMWTGNQNDIPDYPGRWA